MRSESWRESGCKLHRLFAAGTDCSVNDSVLAHRLRRPWIAPWQRSEQIWVSHRFLISTILYCLQKSIIILVTSVASVVWFLHLEKLVAAVLRFFTCLAAATTYNLPLFCCIKQFHWRAVRLVFLCGVAINIDFLVLFIGSFHNRLSSYCFRRFPSIELNWTRLTMEAKCWA